MSFYHLPHPWDPGYAIPRYVMAEPPERGTFTTAWMPRGTIPGLIPDYFANPMGAQKLLGRNDAQLSGLGSLGGSTLAGNTLAGSTLRGNTLAGSSLGANEYVLEPLGNGVTGAITKFGAKTAKQMIAQIKRLPPQHRGDAMKQAMARIDPTLRPRCEQYAVAAQKSGLPAPKAFELGLARALSEGVTAEFQRLGRSRELPQPSSLLGLGLDCARSRTQGALGATPNPLLSSFAQVTTGGSSSSSPPLITGGGDIVKIGPFEFPASKTGDFAVEFKDPAALARLPEAQKKNIRDQILAGDGVRTGNTNFARDPAFMQPLRVAGSDPPRLVQPLRYPGMCKWIEALGLKCDQPLTGNFISQQTPEQQKQYLTLGQLEEGNVLPIAAFTHPTTGDAWGIFLLRPFVWPKGSNGQPKEVGSFDDTGKFYIVFRKFPSRDWLHKIGHGIQRIAGAIGKVSGTIGNVVKTVGSAVCGLVTNPNFAAGAATAAVKTKNPAGVATAGGIVVASQLCGGFQTPPPPFFPPMTSSLLMPLVLVGGGILAVMALTRGE